MSFESKDLRADYLRKRFNYLVSVVFLGCLIVLLMILIPTVAIHSRDITRESKALSEEKEAVQEWVNLLHSTTNKAISNNYELEGLVFSNLTSLPNLDDSPEVRLIDQNYTKFDYVAASIISKTGELNFLALCPGGVVGPNEYPPGGGTWNLSQKDLFTKYSFLLQNVDTGTSNVFVPFRATEGEVVWSLIAVLPVYNATSRPLQNKGNFWGFALLEIDAQRVIDDSDIILDMWDRDMDFLLLIASESTYYLLATSLDTPLSEDEMYRFIDAATTNERLTLSSSGVYIAVLKKGKKKRLTSDVLAMVICLGAAVGLMLVALAAFIASSCLRQYNGVDYAPKYPPFAMLVIGPRNAEQLWNIASDEMSDATERLSAVLEECMEKFHAYQIPQLQPYTTTYILRTVNSAILMAFSVIEQLQKHPIDTELVRLLGDNGRVFVSYATHWCTNGTVSIDSSGSIGRLRYEGQDLLFGARIWQMSVPSLIILSEAARKEITSRSFRVQFFRLCAAGRNEAEEALYFVFDPSRALLQHAKAEAEEMLRDPLGHSFNPLSQQPPNGGDGGGDTGGSSDLTRGADVNARRLFTATEREGDAMLTGDEIERIEGHPNLSLMEPQIPFSLSNSLKAAFEYQAISSGIEFESVKAVVYYFFSCFRLMFKPLAAPQRHNIYMRLVTAFGVPQEGLLEHLAAHCTVRYIQQKEEAKTFEKGHQLRLERNKRHSHGSK